MAFFKGIGNAFTTVAGVAAAPFDGFTQVGKDIGDVVKNVAPMTSQTNTKSASTTSRPAQPKASDAPAPAPQSNMPAIAEMPGHDMAGRDEKDMPCRSLEEARSIAASELIWAGSDYFAAFCATRKHIWIKSGANSNKPHAPHAHNMTLFVSSPENIESAVRGAEDLYAFLRNTPEAVPSFFKFKLTDSVEADYLGKAVKFTPDLAHFTDSDGRRAIDVAHPTCKQAMQAALFLLGRFDVDGGPLLHRSATAAVAAAADHDDPEAKPVPRVALKAMRGVEQVRAELEGRAGLDPKYVIAIKAVYADEEAVDAGSWNTVVSAAAGLEGIVLERVPGLSMSIQAHFFKPDARQSEKAGGLVRQATPQHCFILVLELADRTLKHSIDHENIAGEDLVAIRNYSNALAHALDDVHRQGRIQGDFKPLNTGAVGMTWKLLDFDCCCKIDELFGNKIPSSSFCPPEMAKALLQHAMNDQGKVSGAKLVEYKASVAYDLWSFGVVLYHLCFGRPLWLTNTNDNVGNDDLRILALAAESDSSQLLRSVLDKAMELDKAMGERQTAPKVDELKTAVALLRKLLEPDADKRLAHFKFAKSCMASVLAEPFFQAESYDKNLSPITGIPNKAAYDLLLKQAPQGRLRCVYSIDMANLKVLNDGSSHDEADVVLKWYAEQLQKEASRLKEHALVQDAGAYHVHGDEFCVVVCAAQGVDEAAFTVQAQETLRKIAAIQYINKQKPSYPETYLRIGALCAPDADYEKADILQNLVGKQLKRDYPDRSKVCPLAGRCNYRFESVDVDGKRRAAVALENPPSGASEF